MCYSAIRFAQADTLKLFLKMDTRDLQDQLFRLSLKSLMHSLRKLSQECDHIKQQGMTSPQQIQDLLALHNHLMETVCDTLVRFMTENPAFSNAVHERLHTSELESLLQGTGVKLCTIPD